MREITYFFKKISAYNRKVSLRQRISQKAPRAALKVLANWKTLALEIQDLETQILGKLRIFGQCERDRFSLPYPDS
jgi:hypothetical protein